MFVLLNLVMPSPPLPSSMTRNIKQTICRALSWPELSLKGKMGSYMYDDLHQVLLCEGISAVDQLCQHDWQHLVLVHFHMERLERTECIHIGTHQLLQILTFLKQQSSHRGEAALRINLREHDQKAVVSS